MSTQARPPVVSRLTTTSFRAMKEAGKAIVMVTAYDFNSARLVEAAGLDAILVGDSMGMTVMGESSTLPVTVDDIVRATRSVSRATQRVLVVADMPFMSYQADYVEGMHNAGRLLSEGGAQAVKVEGATGSTLTLIKGLVGAGIPVQGHIGLTPQSVHTLGGYRTQGKDAPGATALVLSALALQDAGCFSLVLECVPLELAEKITAMLSIPTIGIGAGVGCDGQVQVFHDLLGLGDFTPRHAKRYANLDEETTRAMRAYADDVRNHVFPGEPQSTHVDPAVLADVSSRLEESLSTAGE
ncbi:MAG: 3-methyl-2-oxobutanoate hydroxymethyltransferase [Gaiellales bacterium]|nr:3-methyl-2-oxobutanoate hydroxymethyltransferase [Gaiellales bacterium]